MSGRARAPKRRRSRRLRRISHGRAVISLQRVFRRRRSRRIRRSFTGTRLGRAGRAGLILGGFPAKKLAKLRYVTWLALGNSTTPNAYAYRLNSVFDTDIPAAGHQPRFFDQWSALYNHYTVLGAKVTLTWQPTTNAELSQNPARFGIYIPADANDTDLPLAGQTPTSIFENKRMGPYRNCGGSTTMPRGRGASVTKKWSAKKYFGVSDLIKNGGATTASNPYGAATTANPTNIAAAMPYVVGLDGTASGGFSFQYQCDFIVLFDDLIEPGGS